MTLKLLLCTGEKHGIVHNVLAPCLVSTAQVYHLTTPGDHHKQEISLLQLGHLGVLAYIFLEMSRQALLQVSQLLMALIRSNWMDASTVNTTDGSAG